MLLLLFEDCGCQEIKKDLRSHFWTNIPLANPKAFCARPERVSNPAWHLVRALFESEFTIELLNSRVSLASGTFKSLAIQNPDCTAGVLDHALGL